MKSLFLIFVFFPSVLFSQLIVKVEFQSNDSTFCSAEVINNTSNEILYKGLQCGINSTIALTNSNIIWNWDTMSHAAFTIANNGRLLIISNLSIENSLNIPSNSSRSIIFAKLFPANSFFTLNESFPKYLFISRNDSIVQVAVTFIIENLISNISNNLQNIDLNLRQNYPNPFNSSTIIEYSIPEYSNVKLNVYNTLGINVLTLVDEYKNAGNYRAELSMNNFSSGIYFVRLISNNISVSKTLTLIK